MFADLGVNMFGSDEDRELLEAMTGKGASSSSGSGSGSGSSSAGGAKGKMVDFFSRGAEADDELLRSLKDQMGTAGLDEEGAAPGGAGGKGASASSMFDALIGGPSQAAPTRSSAIIPAGSPAPAAAGAAGGAGYRPALTVEEAEELTRSLDDMTDAEVPA